MKKRRIVLLVSLALLLVACGGSAELEAPADLTPLPTAVQPTGGAQEGNWNLPFAAIIPPGYLSEGEHRYALWVKCPLDGLENMSSGWISFIVSESFQMLDVNVFLRLGGISNGPLAPPNLPGFNPQQEGVQALVTLLGLSDESLQQATDECEMVIVFNNGTPSSLELEPLEAFEG